MGDLNLSRLLNVRLASSMSPAKVPLDFHLLPALDRATIFMRLSRRIEENMKGSIASGETLDRARAAAMFFRSASSESESWWNEAFLRAGLGEFVSMSSALSRDLEAAGSDKTPHRIQDSRNPLLHLMLILRNVNFHAHRNRVDNAEARFIFRDGDYEQEIDSHVVVIGDLNVEILAKKREVRKVYSQDDLCDVVEWFKSEQMAFGAGEIFATGVELYCHELLSRYTCD
jgi:hypothetical protein